MKNLITLIIISVSLLSFAGEKPNHAKWDELLKANVSSQGFVDYKQLKINEGDLSNYLIELKNNSPEADWSKDEKLAYYINLYNAYTIKFILTKYPIKSVKDLSFSGKDLWNFKNVSIGENKYTLNQLENDIIRKMKDPRIHFAVNCGAISCPKLLNRAYTAKTLQADLDKVTKDFINNPNHNSITKGKVRISEIFNWYKDDFISDKKTVIDFLNKYVSEPIKEDAKIEYLPYNWSLNGK